MNTSVSVPEAWARIPAPAAGPTAQPRFTGQRMERIMAIVVGVGATGLAIQSVIAAMAALEHADLGEVVLCVVVFASLAAMIVACLVGRGVRVVAGTFACVYSVALALWPLVAVGGGAAGTQPWIFFLLNIAAVAAILAFPLRLQTVVVVALPFLYGFVRVAEGEFSQGFWIATAFDVSFTLILGVVLLALAWVFRSVGAGVDDARGVAVTAYAAAAAAEAMEEERVAVAALMHDSVLAALIAAERAESERERELAVAMAREALTRLANTEEHVAREGGDAPIGWAQVVLELRRMLSESGADAVVEVRGEAGPVPERVARAAVLAARQACANAMQHAHGRGLHILAAGEDDGFVLIISDAGSGFDPGAIPEDRLGIRASIVARMAAVAGSAEITTDAHGTAVELRWRRG